MPELSSGNGGHETFAEKAMERDNMKLKEVNLGQIDS